ncbi:hypothetical protein LEN26_014208 [Aphanomyces euteiches]|nr:hypothetical protein AeMF1_019579 [Aphanomyces euteiches]KAH9108029.1 hypothetical protein LEN26_014208 [Aphanomyces euteiches]KAH9195592.1 hypothetical protein AeNC1_002416 [Aphanomyces euteiches]
MFRSKTVLHVLLNDGDSKHVVPLTIYISPESDLDWLNQTAPDPTYFEQIVDCLQHDEWAVLQSQVQALTQPSKKSEASAFSSSREILLDAIKFTYEVRPNSRSYNVLSPQTDDRFSPIPMASFEIIVRCYPKHVNIPSMGQDPQLAITAFFKPDDN